MAAYERIEETRELTQGLADKRGVISYYIGKDIQSQEGFHKYVNHVLLTQSKIKKELEVFKNKDIDAVIKILK